MTARASREEAQRVAALASASLGEAVTETRPLGGALGLRRFYRIFTERGRSAIARVEAEEDPAGRPPGIPPEPPLEPIRALLERAGLPVPKCYGRAAGIELLEDFGDDSLYARSRRVSADELQGLVARALDLVPCIQRVRDDGSGVDAFARRLDSPYFAYKADLFARYSLEEALGRAPRPSEDAVVREAFAWIDAQVSRAPLRLAHRDFQSQNLMLRMNDTLGMIDLQGAFLAPPEYDLVCLLRDSYLDLPESFVESELARVRPMLPDAPDWESLRSRFDLLTLTRKGKDHARFVYAARERGDLRYLAHAPRTGRMLARAALRSASLDPRLERLRVLLACWGTA